MMYITASSERDFNSIRNNLNALGIFYRDMTKRIQYTISVDSDIKEKNVVAISLIYNCRYVKSKNDEKICSN